MLPESLGPGSSFSTSVPDLERWSDDSTKEVDRLVAEDVLEDHRRAACISLLKSSGPRQGWAITT